MDLVNLQEMITLETLYTVFSILVVADVISGVIKAWKQGRLRSRTLRDGLIASIGELFMLLLCILAAELVPITSIVVFAVLLFMALKELISICENLLEIGVKLPSFLIKGLQIKIDQINGGIE